jgi:hypothetical protein
MAGLLVRLLSIDWTISIPIPNHGCKAYTGFSSSMDMTAMYQWTLLRLVRLKKSYLFVFHLIQPT